MEEIHRKVPLNTKVLPTSLTKRACEEEMESCFFDIVIAQGTIIVVSFKLVLLPLENISGIESVHQQQPGEHPKLVATFGLPNP